MERSVIGRDAELAALAPFLDAVAAGPAALLLEGEAVIGKTTVWAEGTRLARERGYRVLSAGPAESEATFSFAGLSDIAEGTLEDALPILPGPQRRALEAALLRAEPEGPAHDQQVVSVAFLGLLRNLAVIAPVIVAIDDLQWLDSPSARVLEFCLRRLQDERIALLASIRIPTPLATSFGVDRALPQGRVERLEIGPLSLGAIQRIVRETVTPGLSRPTMRRIHEAAGGNPFYALEIARAMDRRGIEPGPHEPLPIPGNLQALVRERLSALPAETRQVLLMAAATPQPTTALLAGTRSAARLARSLRPAVEAGVVDRVGEQVRFTHPLLASERYAQASPAERRRVHRRLAEAVKDLEERARHLARATDGPGLAINPPPVGTQGPLRTWPGG